MPRKILQFPVLLEQDEDGYYIASCPSFRGCHSFGRTIEEALKNIREAIELCLEEEKDIPESRLIGYREVALEVDLNEETAGCKW